MEKLYVKTAEDEHVEMYLKAMCKKFQISEIIGFVLAGVFLDHLHWEGVIPEFNTGIL